MDDTAPDPVTIVGDETQAVSPYDELVLSHAYTCREIMLINQFCFLLEQRLVMLDKLLIMDDKEEAKMLQITEVLATKYEASIIEKMAVITQDNEKYLLITTSFG